MIVVIDDERTVQATLSAVLERNKFAVEIAPNASQGRRKVLELKPDLVLLDLGLPDADGLEVLKELKAAQPGLPVIILTANDSLANAIEAIKLGAFHFLSKPCRGSTALSVAWMVRSSSMTTMDFDMAAETTRSR